MLNIYTLNLLFGEKKMSPKIRAVKKIIESTSSHDEQVLMFLNKKKKKLRFWVDPILTFYCLNQGLKLCHSRLHTYFRVSVRQFVGRVGNTGRQKHGFREQHLSVR